MAWPGSDSPVPMQWSLAVSYWQPLFCRIFLRTQVIKSKTRGGHEVQSFALSVFVYFPGKLLSSFWSPRAAKRSPFWPVSSHFDISASSHLLNSLRDSSACFFAQRTCILVLFPSSFILRECTWTLCPQIFLYFECSHLGNVPANNSGARCHWLVPSALSVQW